MKIKENYAAIERTVALVKEKFGADSKIAVMFEKCISNTLQTTIKIKENDTVFVITGDIPAMWLRDSACQLRPFLLFAKEEPELVELFGIIVPTLRAAICAVYKSGVLKEYEVQRYVRLENGYHADVFSFPMIVALAFRAEQVRNAIFKRLYLRKEKTSIFFSLGINGRNTSNYQA